MNLILKKLSIFACCLLIFQSKAALDAREEIRQLSSVLSAKLLKDDFGISRIIKERNQIKKFDFANTQNMAVKLELSDQANASPFSLLPSEIKVEIIKKLFPIKRGSPTQLMETLVAITNFALTNRENFNFIRDTSEYLIKLINSRISRISVFNNIANTEIEKNSGFLPFFQENLVFAYNQYLFFSNWDREIRRIIRLIDKDISSHNAIQSKTNEFRTALSQLNKKGFNKNIALKYENYNGHLLCVGTLLELVIESGDVPLFKELMGNKKIISFRKLLNSIEKMNFDLASYIANNYQFKNFFVGPIRMNSWPLMKEFEYRSFAKTMKEILMQVHLYANSEVWIKHHERTPAEEISTTLLILAIENQDLEMIKFLLEKGANIVIEKKIKTINGHICTIIRKSPLEIAQEIGNQEIISLLQEEINKSL